MNYGLALLCIALSLSTTVLAADDEAALVKPVFPLTMRYVCDGGRLVVVTYPDPDAANNPPIDLVWRGHHYHLSQAISASGARYINDTLVWWNKGRSGFLTTRGGRMLAKHCEERPQPQCRSGLSDPLGLDQGKH